MSYLAHRSPLRRTLAVALTMPLALAACESPTAAAAPDADPAFRRAGSGKPVTTTESVMSMSPGDATIAVGGKATVAVTYYDRKGEIVPVTDFRWTYYGCRPVAPAGAYCFDYVSILPLPGLREAEVTGLRAGEVELYATDGVGHEVVARVRVQ